MFIRIKDGIYEFDELNEKNLNSNVIDIYNCLGLETQIRKCDILKQSDNLAELIDEFVVIRNSTKTNQLVRTDNIKYLKEMIENDKRIIAVKGAVWTDKGLIYVAEMDNDGNLELL